MQCRIFNIKRRSFCVGEVFIMYYPKEVIDEVRMGNDIVDVIGDYVKLTKSGSSYKGLCPFHNEKTPSFIVNRENQFYHCFGCGVGGNVISFLMEHTGLSYIDAVKFLAERINYELPEENYSQDMAKKRELKQKLYEIHKTAARFYYDNLISPEGKKAKEYLNNRQVSNSARIKFGLGYSPIAKGALYKKLTECGYDDEIIFKSGLAYKKDDGVVFDKFFNRLMFPIIDVYGNVIGFGGRILGDGQPKYLNSPESEIFTKSDNLYNLNLARKSKSKELILVEGYMDAIAIYQAGFTNVVASLGTAFNERHAKVLKNYAKSVILLFDSDDAGTKAILRAIPVLKKASLRVKVVQVTDAKDPDEYIKKFGASAFGELIKNAKSSVIFQAEQIRKNYDLNMLEEKISFMNEIAKIMSDSDNSIETDVYLKEISDMTNIDLSSVKNEIERLYNREPDKSAFNKNNKTTIKKIGTDEAKRSIIALIAENKGLYGILKDKLKPEYLQDELYAKVLKIIYELYENDRPVITANIVSYFEDIKEQNKVSDIFINKADYNSEKLEKAVNDQLKDILKAYYTSLMNDKNNHDKLNDIMLKYKKVNDLHISLVKG